MKTASVILCWFVLTLAGTGGLQALPVATTNHAGALILTNSFGDVNNDVQVNALDIVRLSHHINGLQLLATNFAARADLNQDSKVDDDDRRILADCIVGARNGPNDDFDGDELGNLQEILRGTNPFHPDSDRDGWWDGWEVADGADPLNPLSGIPLTLVAHPPLKVVFPKSDGSAAETGGVVVASPPVRVVLPALSAAEEAGAITVADPPIKVLFPPMHDANTNSLGPVVANPPVRVPFGPP